MNLKEQTVNFETDDLTAQIDKTTTLVTAPPLKATRISDDEDQRRIQIKNKPVYAFVKRFADIILSLAASIVLIIPIAVIAVAIMIKDPGNPFYVHIRVGKNHKPIKILKLRSMKMGADRLESMLTSGQLEEYKREYKLDDDPRLIGWKKQGDGNRCFGARLRQWSLDELPQIPYNILLKGERDIIETTGRNVGFSRVVAA